MNADRQPRNFCRQKFLAGEVAGHGRKKFGQFGILGLNIA